MGSSRCFVGLFLFHTILSRLDDLGLYLGVQSHIFGFEVQLLTYAKKSSDHLLCPGGIWAGSISY